MLIGYWSTLSAKIKNIIYYTVGLVIVPATASYRYRFGKCAFQMLVVVGVQIKYWLDCKYSFLDPNLQR